MLEIFLSRRLQQRAYSNILSIERFFPTIMTMTSERSSVGNTLCFLSMFFASSFSLSFFLSPPFSVLLPLSQYGLFLSLSPSLPVSFSHLNTLNLCLFLWFRSLFQSLQCFEPSLSLTFSLSQLISFSLATVSSHQNANE